MKSRIDIYVKVLMITDFRCNANWLHRWNNVFALFQHMQKIISGI